MPPRADRSRHRAPRTDLSRSPRGHNVPASVVVKMPTLDEQARRALGEDLELYLKEVRFYQEIGNANPLPPAHPYFAAIDEATHDFILVLEDLRHLRVADQTIGCTPGDAETVVDAIARQHAHWWQSNWLSTLPWLRPYATPPFPAVLAANASGLAALRELVGADLSSRLGFRATPAIADPVVPRADLRPPCTFIHGDLRLDQLFFGTRPGDPAVTALDWQVTQLGRGALRSGVLLSARALTTEAGGLRGRADRALPQSDSRGRNRLPASELQRLLAHHGALLHLSPACRGTHRSGEQPP